MMKCSLSEAETPFRNFEIRRWRFLQTQCRLYVLSSSWEVFRIKFHSQNIHSSYDAWMFYHIMSLLHSWHVQIIQIEIYPGSLSVFLHRATSSRWSDLCGAIEKNCTEVLAQELQHRSRTLMQSHSQILKKIAPREPRFYILGDPPLRKTTLYFPNSSTVTLRSV